MFNKFLRENKVAMVILTLMRLSLGWTFLHAGWGKLTGPGFDASGFLKGAIANPPKDAHTQEVLFQWWVNFLKDFALPNVHVFNTIVPIGEFLIGLGLILGCLTTYAVFFGLVMNFSFFFSGTVSTNPEDILFGVIIAAAGANAGKIGLDYWVMPFLTKKLFKKKNNNTNPNV